MSDKSIYMNYQATLEKAARLEELAAKMRNMADQELADYTRGNVWQGDAGQTCRSKVTKLQNNIKSRAKELDNTAKAIRRAAKRQYDLEKTLISIVSR